MTRNIRLHTKHGLNPTMPTCFWCGKERGDIALLGAAYKGEAPRTMLLDYEPCAACKARFALGILVAEVVPAHEDRAARSINGNVPTGRYAVIKEEAFSQVFDNCDEALQLRRCFVDRETFKKSGLEEACAALEGTDKAIP